MNNSYFTSLLICLLWVVNVTFAQSSSASLIKKVEGFSHPESIVFDEKTNQYFVSNMAGDIDGDGFISKVSAEGEIIELRWVEGLKDPKGLLIKDANLYVTNNTELIKINIKNSEITKRTEVEGAKSLNDITVDNQGNIFISDSGKSAIYLLPGDGSNMMVPEESNREILEYLDTTRLEYVNGLYAQGNDLYVAAWGENQDGNFIKVNLENREIEKISQEGIGNLDGIQPVGEEWFYLSDWATGDIYLAKKDGEIKKILTSEKSSGDILFLAGKDQLVLPMNHQNSIWWYQLE